MESAELERTLERVAFLEHKIMRVAFLVTTSRGLDQPVRERLLRVLAADSLVGIEQEMTEGD